MIKFQGKISNNCKKFLQKWEISGSKIASIIVSLLLSVAIILVAIYWSMLALIFLVFCVALIVVGWLPNKNIESRIPQEVIINEDFLSVQSIELYYTNKLEMVKNIIDYGEWYKINFYFPNKNGYFICQKNLLVEGTIEEFEKLFEGKIIRKIK